MYDITLDPGQHNDLAGAYPEVVRDLYSRYEKWWDDNAPPPDWYAGIHAGSEKENPLTLYAHDAYSRNGQKIWVVHVERDGRYEIQLNRWPVESGKRMVENKLGDKDLPLIRAQLIIGNRAEQMEITPDMTTAAFIVNLKAGTTCLHTSLILSEGGTVRTDCVYVKFLGDPVPGSLADYIPSVPDIILRKYYMQKVLLFD